MAPSIYLYPNREANLVYASSSATSWLPNIHTNTMKVGFGLVKDTTLHDTEMESGGYKSDH